MPLSDRRRARMARTASPRRARRGAHRRSAMPRMQSVKVAQSEMTFVFRVGQMYTWGEEPDEELVREHVMDLGEAPFKKDSVIGLELIDYEEEEPPDDPEYERSFTIEFAVTVENFGFADEFVEVR